MISGLPCPVCGAKDGSCGPHTPLAFPPITLGGVMANEGKIYLKQQNTRRGTAGYKNLGPNVEVVDDTGRTVAKGSEKKK